MTEKPRRYRPLPEKLGSVVLGFESIVVFLGGLAIFGLRAVPEPVPAWASIVAGAIVAVLMILTAGLLRFRWAFGVGWALQILVACSALLVPAMLIVVLVFGGMWAYATIGGARIEKRAAARPEDDR